MSNAWQVTTKDVQIVLSAHGIFIDPEDLEEARDYIDCEEVEARILAYEDTEDQMNEALSAIEDDLMAFDVIKNSTKKFVGGKIR